MSLRFLRTLLAVLAVAVGTLAAQGQGFTLADGTELTPLLTLAPDHTIGGLDVDAAGNLFYLDVDNTTSHTVLKERTSGGATFSLLTLTNGDVAPILGSFVRVRSGELYYGYGTGLAVTVARGAISGSTGVFTNPTPVATVNGLFDLALSPVDPAGIQVSAATGSQSNQVSTLNPGTGGLTPRVVGIPNFAGPVDFDPAGNLYYGATGPDARGIYRFTAAELASGATFTLDAAHRLLPGAEPSQYLAVDGNGTVFEDSSSASGLFFYEPARGGVTRLLGFGTGDDDLPDFLATGVGRLFFSVTDVATTRSAVFSVVPEPGLPALLAAGVILIGFRRRPRSGWRACL